MTPRKPSLDGKTIVALVIALIGGAEMRIQVGLLAGKVDRIEARLDSAARVAHGE